MSALLLTFLCGIHLVVDSVPLIFSRQGPKKKNPGKGNFIIIFFLHRNHKSVGLLIIFVLFSNNNSKPLFFVNYVVHKAKD